MSTQTESATKSAAPQRKHIRHDLPWDERCEIAYEIFDRISHGEMLRDICSEEGMPHPNTLRNWAYQHKPLAFFYTCAQKLRLDGLLEELMELTEVPAPMCKDSRGNQRVDNAAVALMKHRFEAKKWIFNILQRDPNWVDYGQRDPSLTHYPGERPLSPPRTPPAPVHKISEEPPAGTDDDPNSRNPQGAATFLSPSSPPPQAHLPNHRQHTDPELETQNSEPSPSPSPVHNKSEPTAAVTSDDPNSRNPQGATTLQPALSLSNGPSLTPPQAHLPNHPQHTDPEPKTKAAPSAPPPSPVHSRVERDSLSASSGQPEGAAPEGASNNSDSTAAVTSDDPNSRNPQGATTLQPALSLSNGPSSPQPQAHHPNDPQHIEPEPKTKTEPSAGPTHEANPEPKTPNSKPSASPNAGRSLRFRTR